MSSASGKSSLGANFSSSIQKRIFKSGGTKRDRSSMNTSMKRASCDDTEVNPMFKKQKSHSLTLRGSSDSATSGSGHSPNSTGSCSPSVASAAATPSLVNSNYRLTPITISPIIMPEVPEYADCRLYVPICTDVQEEVYEAELKKSSAEYAQWTLSMMDTHRILYGHFLSSQQRVLRELETGIREERDEEEEQKMLRAKNNEWRFHARGRLSYLHVKICHLEYLMEKYKLKKTRY